MKNKVIVGLSGGVDSSVAAALLMAQGYQVEGVYLECYSEPGCRSDQDKADALKVALKLGIKFQVLDFRKEYREKVIEYFYKEYEEGRTPNPDVMCNKEIKFGIFYDYTMSQGYDYVATGHYARICKVTSEKGQVTTFLQRARDESKDQSYFLCEVPRENLEHILFPLGNMLKSEVRAKAKTLGLITADKPDSMGICFIGEVSVAKLLKDKLGEKKGDVILQCHSDTVKQFHIGSHNGHWFFTVGQRGGWKTRQLDHSTIESLNHLGIDMNNLPPLYVIGKDAEKNEIIVGKRDDAMKREFKIDKGPASRQGGQVTNDKWGKTFVRIRNLGELYEVTRCHCDPPNGETSIVILDRPIFAPSPGQSAVFYDRDGVLVAHALIV